MKTRYAIFWVFRFALLAMGLSLSSCMLDEEEIPQSGIVQVEIAEVAGALTRSDDETMNTVRLIVFTDLNGAAPRAEINRLYMAGDDGFTVEPATSGTPAKARFTLKVERSAAGSNEKLIVAVINEPTAPDMKAALDAVAAPADLDGIELEMSHFVAPDHLSLKDDVMIPMTGALWTDRLFRTEDEASRTGNLLKLEAQRVVARVDVYLKRGEGVEPDLNMAAGSTVTLTNTYTKGNFFYHSDGANTVGSIPTVASGFVDRSWTYTGAEQAIPENEPVCVFYTPEREHTANRLRLDIAVKTAEGATRSGSLEITRAKDAGGIEHTVDRILRNHIYKVTATVGVNGITADVAGWNDEEIGTDL